MIEGHLREPGGGENLVDAHGMKSLPVEQVERGIDELVARVAALRAALGHGGWT